MGSSSLSFRKVLSFEDLNRFHALGSGWQGSECEGFAFQLMEALCQDTSAVKVA